MPSFQPVNTLCFQKTLTRLEKIDKWDYIKIKIVSSPKDPIKRKKRQFIDPKTYLQYKKGLFLLYVKNPYK